MMTKGFIDVLFILLCGAIVMLSQSLHVGSVKTAPAKVGGGAISPVRADQVRPVIVRSDVFELNGQKLASVDALVNAIKPGEAALLIAGDEDLSHHRMMAIWSALQERGVTVKLGASPTGKPRAGSRRGIKQPVPTGPAARDPRVADATNGGA